MMQLIRQAISTTLSWTIALSLEFFTLLTVFAFRIFPLSKSTSGGKHPVILIHGYLNGPNVWWLQKKWLQKKGIGPIYPIKLKKTFGSIEDYTEQLRGQIEQIQKKDPASSMTLIGHSMGGLVCLDYRLKYDREGKKCSVITIAAPIKGTMMANFALGINAKQMRKKSPLIEEINRFLQEKPPKIYTIGTQTDQLVIPGRSAVLSEGNHLLCNGIGHASLLYSNKVASQITKWMLHPQ